MSEEDYSSLPLDERLVHNVWKVRLSAYEELAKLFENSRNDQDDCFQTLNQRPELVKKFSTDSNVVAQETALKTVSAYLKYGGSPTVVGRLKGAGVITSICEKGLSSSRAKTKEYATEILLQMVEISPQPDTIIEDIIPSLSNRLPKLVAGCVSALHAIVENFGCAVILPKGIIPSLGKLFGHADRNVRAETTKLTVELYKWMGDSLESVLFPNLKPVQQKDLTKAFDAVKGTSVEQQRLTRSQQLELEKLESNNGANQNEDVDMDDAGDVQSSAPTFDPADLVDPVEVLNKLPSDLDARIGSAKWKDRKEALDDVYAILEKTIKLANDDYTPLIRIFSKCMKDANIQVVQLAANCTEFIVRGLGKSFNKYQTLILAPMIERTKEKKASVATALETCLDAIFKTSSLGDVLEDILAGMKHKTPQVKIASTNYLQRCLASTTVAPSRSEIDSIMEIGVKLLSESQEPIRQASTEMIGTLMKITGERELNVFLEKIDDNRKAKVNAFFETVQVNSKLGSGSKAGQSTSSNSNISDKRSGTVPQRKTKVQTSAPSIPAKRGASSPVKRIDEAPKVSAFGRGLTGRSLASSNTPALQLPNHNSSKQRQEPALTSAERDELHALREEKNQWLAQQKRDNQIQVQLKEEIIALTQEVSHIRSQSDLAQKDLTNALLMAKQKETQIHRLNSDLESARLKSRDLEQTIELMKLKQNQAQVPQSFNHNGLYNNSNGSPFESKVSNEFRSPEPRPRVTSGELSSRVKRLSIDSDTFKENSFLSKSSNSYNRFSPQKSPELTPARETLEVDSNDDSWKRAAEVTSQLKARIEKMKARSRNSTLNFMRSYVITTLACITCSPVSSGTGFFMILVPVKRVIDAAIRPRINKALTGVETKGVKFSINPFCDIALEESLRIREANKGLVDSIHAVSIGPTKSQDVLRTALAKGADSSTLVDVGDQEVEPLNVAKLLKQVVEKQESNLVILGKQAIDDDSNQTGQMLAGLLNWPQATNASKVEIDGDTVTVTREIDGGADTLRAKLPMIITTDLRLNEPRYASLPNVMKAKKKPLEKLKAADLGIEIASRLETIQVVEPPARDAGIKVESVDELISKLKEAKAL
ncbi:uncharacterized protein CANTADRAFT_20928 [Suhomyces tanzawaensis NRRL Y-17324]|uniref:Probable electron transfer flavoprotein subunit beta n=1 Tax=Suhomyces tanzawaensis NRRL Y-17324 TaxID=984487 RepID=A0A1E4SJD8_9ASCO|nr:uncharacterized protein CANTADRAFT_20928 [Suhomyces tanzawaensis NRRL Y-17324]ODV79626.1 hypothetical protein CANTADRAFT_20928 [Suhomyces tanzawaensis NRRL Y-17324]